MKKYFFLIVFSFLLFTNCDNSIKEKNKKLDTYVQDNYDKKEVTITMRDGTKLHTAIYSPKDKNVHDMLD